MWNEFNLWISIEWWEWSFCSVYRCYIVNKSYIRRSIEWKKDIRCVVEGFAENWVNVIWSMAIGRRHTAHSCTFYNASRFDKSFREKLFSIAAAGDGCECDWGWISKCRYTHFSSERFTVCSELLKRFSIFFFVLFDVTSSALYLGQIINYSARGSDA